MRVSIFNIFRRVNRIVRRRVVRRKVYAPKGKRSEYLKYKEVARELVRNRLEYWNQFYNFKFGRVAIRNTKTRWGSCSKRGNLNFSYKLALLPAHLSDYVIVHELCHLGEFNHSQKFWNLVEEAIPDYKEKVKELKKIQMIV